MSYTGASLESDDRMLPPRLRGMHRRLPGLRRLMPVLWCRSRTGAVRLDGPRRAIQYSGPGSSVRGRLDVEVIEQNGRKKTFRSIRPRFLI